MKIDHFRLQLLITFRFLLLAFAVVRLPVAAPAREYPFRKPGEDVNQPSFRERAGIKPDENLLFNGWGLSPAGVALPVKSDLVLKMILSPDKKVIAAVGGGFNNHGLTLIDWRTREVAQFVPLPKAWNGVAFSKDGRRLFVSGGASGKLHVFNYSDGQVTSAEVVIPGGTNGVFLASIAIHPVSGALYICNEANHEIWVLTPGSLARQATIAVGPYPHTCMFGADQRHLYVSNWGGRSVSIVDTEKNRRLREVTVGLRPNDLALAPDGRLFVACAGDNSVYVLQTAKLEKAGPEASPARRLWEGAREVISTSLYPQSPEGSAPSGLAVSSDGKSLFVANSDNNCVMVVDISNALSESAKANKESVSVVNGFIPTGWYPSAVAVTPDENTLLVANGKGLSSRSNALAPTNQTAKPKFEYIGRTLAGSISFIPRPDALQMAAYTEQVRKNSPYRPESFHSAPFRSETVIPDQVGAPCAIKYVLYIIKENRTYDQVLGDLKDARGKPIGNGDSNLCLYGESITPNHHQLAREYVLLDNLYCNGEVSVDGHSWCDAAIATDFNQRSWILSYSKHGKLPGNEEMETPANGYLWDLCRRHGVTFKNYGEGAQRVPSPNRGKWPGGGRDMDKVKWWIQDLQRAEKTGVLPQFTIMSLGEDHTRGTKKGELTPDASVASNDLGLGRVVEAATRSKFWKQMAIFVIEDDAQNGPDHVDAHRTVGLVISPYCKRRFVDSTLYTTASMIRTIELILGLPPMTQFDAGATPMFHCFEKRAQVLTYTLVPTQVDVLKKNTRASVFWRESGKMNFAEYDRAPEDELNRILWHAAKGLDTPYPAPIHRALFTK